LLKCA
ncbi:ATP-dependent DNA helicase Rep domain protein, partial [Vibrio parahaemolyticus V-223/04]